MQSLPRRRSHLAICVLISLIAPASMAARAQAADPSKSTVCAAASTPFAQVFNRSPWYDTGYYTLSPAGNSEGTLTNWTLSGGAKVVSGNESYYVGAKTDRRSLALPDGSSVTSAPMCVGLNYPWMRFFLRNSGSSSGRLKVEVRSVTLLGTVTSLLPVTLSGTSSWQLSPRLLLVDNLNALLTSNGLTPISFRFTPGGGNWQIDDVYVDPYRSR